MRYGSINSWAKYFENCEGHNISAHSISFRLSKSGIDGVAGKSINGRVHKFAFYAENDVREACRDLLQDLSAADENGFFDLKGVRYGTIGAWCKLFELSKSGIIIRLNRSNKQSIKGRCNGGQIREFYAEKDVKSVCEDLLDDLPQADEDGFFEIDNVKYGTIKAWTKALQISDGAITNRLRKSNKKSIKGKIRGLIFSFYSESDVLSACDDLLGDYHQANEDGFFENEGVEYRTIISWSKVLPISSPAIADRMLKKNIHSIRGKTIQGQVRDFYSEIDVLTACEDILTDYPQTNSEGFFEKDGVKYRTVVNWGSTLNQHYHNILIRLKKAGIQSTTGKDEGGHICDFYAETDVLCVSSDIMAEYPRADENGFLEIDGVKYGTATSWGRIFPLNATTISKNLKKLKITAIKGRLIEGNICDFYPETDVTPICEDIISNNPQAGKKDGRNPKVNSDVNLEIADENGFFILDGVKYGTVAAWSKATEASESVIFARLKKVNKQGIPGRNARNKICTFYADQDIRTVCSDLLIQCPRADENNFFILDGVKYGTVAAWSKLTKILKSTIAGRLRNVNKNGIKGRKSNGRICTFYADQDIRTVCSDLLIQCPRADENGFFEKDGKRYGSIQVWARMLSISNALISKRIRKANMVGINGKTRGGTILKFYAEQDIRNACVDIILKYPLSDENGFFEKDGERYGLIQSWANILPISASTIMAKLKESRKKGIEGRMRTGIIYSFYSENEVKEACEGYIEEIPRADKSGFIYKDGMKYGSLYVWSKILNIGDTLIKKRLTENEKEGIKGRNRCGRIIDFYSESDVREVCANFLIDYPQAGEDGFLIQEEVKYGTIGVWGRVLPISEPSITNRLKKAKVRCIKAKGSGGQIYNFYSESDVREACADLLEELPQASEDGFFMLDGVKYGTIATWDKILPISSPAISSRLKESKKTSIKGKDSQGNLWNFYSESDVREACADLLVDMHQADENGFFIKDGRKYGSMNPWARVLGLTADIIKVRLKKHSIKGIKGKLKGGQIHIFYSEEDILRICSDVSDGDNNPNPKAA